MGGEQAAGVLAQVKREGLQRQKKTWPKEEEDKFLREMREKYDREGDPYHSSARLWDDGIIDPADTRTVLGMGLSVAMNAPINKNAMFGVFRM